MERIWTLRWKLGLGLGFGVVERGFGGQNSRFGVFWLGILGFVVQKCVCL